MKQIDCTKVFGQRIGGWLNKQSDIELITKLMIPTAIVWALAYVIKHIH